MCASAGPKNFIEYQLRRGERSNPQRHKTRIFQFYDLIMWIIINYLRFEILDSLRFSFKLVAAAAADSVLLAEKLVG